MLGILALAAVNAKIYTLYLVFFFTSLGLLLPSVAAVANTGALLMGEIGESTQNITMSSCFTE